MPDKVLGNLSWSERSIIRRIRAGYTKAQLADACGLSRLTLYLTMECKDPLRKLEPSDNVRALVDDALSRREEAIAKGSPVYPATLAFADKADEVA